MEIVQSRNKPSSFEIDAFTAGRGRRRWALSRDAAALDPNSSAYNRARCRIDNLGIGQNEVLRV